MHRRHFFGSSLALAVAAALPYRRVSAATTGELSTGDLQGLRGALRGSLLLPGEAGYENARRVLIDTIDRHPALVVQPSGAADVRTAINFARERDLLLAVKCGGHSDAGFGTCDGGMQLDLSQLRGVRVDAASRTAYVAGGSLLGELDHEAMSCGLVTTAGTVSHTGVGGLTLGGGYGRLARRFGLALDNVRSVDIVTADGQLRHASPKDNPDLFWGVRGGGGNFGVVTMFEFALHPMQRQVVSGSLVFPTSRLKELLTMYAQFSTHAPDELYCDFIVSLPAGKDGVVVFSLCYSGAPERAETVLAPLRKLGTPLADTLKARDYVAVQRGGDKTDPRVETVHPHTGFVDEFSSGLIDTLASGISAHPQRSALLFFQHAGGAIGRVAPSATAIPHRHATHNMIFNVAWPNAVDPAPHIAYSDELWSRLGRYVNGFYTNEVIDEPINVVEANYQGNLTRLRALKKKYDAGNLFRLNANVRPVAS
jgi:hypothetical protein